MCVSLQCLSDRTERLKKARFRLILLLVNLDTLLILMQELEKMIAYLNVFVYPYDTASGVNQIPYLHHLKGVQAQPTGIG